MPEVEKEIVTLDESAVDKVAVNVIEEPEFSAIDVALVVSVTVGVVSSSVIVIVTACVPSSVADPPLTPVIETVAVSFPSTELSFDGVKLVVPVVLPALMVMSEIVL